METYLREHSVGTLIRSTFRIYTRHFWIVFLVYTVPTFPAVVLQQEALEADNMPLVAVATILGMFLGFIALGAITVAISDICVGERPSVLRSYRKVFGRTLWKLLWSGFLQVAAVGVGFLLLIVPGFILFVRLLLTQAVVVLENHSGVAALKRSARLVKGHYWRNLAVLFVFFCIVMLGYFALILLGAGAMVLLGGPELVHHWAFRTVVAIFMMGVLYPMFFIVIVLLYYDLRVRKEAYDVHALAEDLRR